MEYLTFASVFIIWQGQENVSNIVENIIDEWKMAYNNIEPMMEIIDFFNNDNVNEIGLSFIEDNKIDFSFIELKNVCFSYPNNKIF